MGKLMDFLNDEGPLVDEVQALNYFQIVVVKFILLRGLEILSLHLKGFCCLAVHFCLDKALQSPIIKFAAEETLSCLPKHF